VESCCWRTGSRLLLAYRLSVQESQPGAQSSDWPPPSAAAGSNQSLHAPALCATGARASWMAVANGEDARTTHGVDPRLLQPRLARCRSLPSPTRRRDGSGTAAGPAIPETCDPTTFDFSGAQRVLAGKHARHAAQVCRPPSQDRTLPISTCSRGPRCAAAAKRVVVLLPFDSGVAKGRNAALAEVATEFVMSVDDDFVFTPELDLNRMIAHLRRSLQVDIVGGLVINLPL